MAICTMLVVIPFWCTAEPEPEEDMRDEDLVVEAQPAPEVEAEPLMSMGGLRPMSELQVREPASRRAQVDETPRLMGPEVVEPEPVVIGGAAEGGPDPRLYGQGGGTTTWTPSTTTMGGTASSPSTDVRLPSASVARTETPSRPASPPRAEVAQAAPVAEPTPAPTLRPRQQPRTAPAPQNYSSVAVNDAPVNTPPSTTYEPTPAPDTTDVAMFDPSSASSVPDSSDVRLQSSAPLSTGPRMTMAQQTPVANNGLRDLAMLLSSGELEASVPVEYEVNANAYAAQAIAQIKRRQYRRTLRDAEREARRQRRQGG